MQEIARNLTAAEQKVARLVDGTGSFFTDYTINDGGLKNVRLGLGHSCRGKEVIGYRGGDTIRTGPTTAIEPGARGHPEPVLLHHAAELPAGGDVHLLSATKRPEHLRCSGLLRIGILATYLAEPKTSTSQ